MEFVVAVLRTFFGLPLIKATSIMLKAHTDGQALVGVYPYEEAYQRVYEAHSAAREAGYPLTFYLEPDE
ncbi:MAG: ATP-dependent Clp protease adaptor ClpS [Chloroflexaceae bacterium]|nr:ATP-dependent Clp protease adaptor ClpS [Chloroflexaceae bacterium]